MAKTTYIFWYKLLRLGEFFERGNNNPLEYKKYTKRTIKTNPDWPEQDTIDVVHGMWETHKEDIFENHPWLKEN